jgi:hypothetical protein
MRLVMTLGSSTLVDRIVEHVDRARRQSRDGYERR